MERATVKTVSPLTIKLETSDQEIPALALDSYSPIAQDRVAVDKLNAQVVVVGSTGPSIRTFTQRAQAALQGGGFRKVTYYSTTVSCAAWSSTIHAIGTGRSTTVNPSGYFGIILPPAGTLITGVSGAPNGLVDEGGAGTGVALALHDALYYILPIGNSYVSVPGNFRKVGYTVDFIIPDNWVLIARRDNVMTEITWFDGQRDTGWITLPLVAPWRNYFAGLAIASYSRENGATCIRGTVLDGTVGSTIGTLLPGFRPEASCAFPVNGPTYSGLNIGNTGNLIYGIGQNPSPYLYLDGIRFKAAL